MHSEGCASAAPAPAATEGRRSSAHARKASNLSRLCHSQGQSSGEVQQEEQQGAGSPSLGPPSWHPGCKQHLARKQAAACRPRAPAAAGAKRRRRSSAAVLESGLKRTHLAVSIPVPSLSQPSSPAATYCNTVTTGLPSLPVSPREPQPQLPLLSVSAGRAGVGTAAALLQALPAGAGALPCPSSPHWMQAGCAQLCAAQPMPQCELQQLPPPLAAWVSDPQGAVLGSLPAAGAALSAWQDAATLLSPAGGVQVVHLLVPLLAQPPWPITPTADEALALQPSLAPQPLQQCQQAAQLPAEAGPFFAALPACNAGAPSAFGPALGAAAPLGAHAAAPSPAAPQPLAAGSADLAGMSCSLEECLAQQRQYEWRHLQYERQEPDPRYGGRDQRQLRQDSPVSRAFKLQRGSQSSMPLQLVLKDLAELPPSPFSYAAAAAAPAMAGLPPEGLMPAASWLCPVSQPEGRPFSLPYSPGSVGPLDPALSSGLSLLPSGLSFGLSQLVSAGTTCSIDLACPLPAW